MQHTDKYIYENVIPTNKKTLLQMYSLKIQMIFLSMREKK